MFDDLQTLDEMIDTELGNETDERFVSMTDEECETSIKKSEERLEKRFLKIEQIRVESFQAAMNDTLVYR